MPAIGRRTLLRRGFLLLTGAVATQGEPKPPMVEMLSRFAASLSAGNEIDALSYFSRNMVGYQAFEANFLALLAQNDVLCSVEVRDETGDEQTRRAETNWYVQIKSKEENGPTQRREQSVKVAIVKEGKRWKIIALEPASVLDLPKI